MNDFTVLVCGGREYADYGRADMILNAVHKATPITLLIHGGAPGADSVADSWADMRQVPVRVFEAEWGRFGKAAGPHRNQRMLDEGKPNLVVAFPGGRGTRDMVHRAESAGVRVVYVE